VRNIELWSSIKSVFAGRPKNVPDPQTIPNDLFNWYTSTVNRTSKYKTVLPRNPTADQLRNFAKNAIVRRPINYIEDTLCNMDYILDNKDINDTNDYTAQKAIARAVIEQPNLIHSRSKLFRMILEDLVVLDSGACEKVPAGDPRHPLYLYPTDGFTIQYVIPYNYTDPNAAVYMQRQQGEMRYFTMNQLAYLKRNHFTDRPQGLSPVLTAYNYIVYLLNANERADAVASNATADYLISLGEKVSESDRERFATYMAEEIEGTGKIPVVAGSDSVDAKQIRAINKDETRIPWQEFLMSIVALSFPFPKEKMGITGSNDRSTAEDLDSIVTNELVKPYGNILEDFVNNDILRMLGYDKLFGMSFVYAQSEAQKTAKSKRLTAELVAGGITENEFRDQMGYARSSSEYADLTTSEKTAKINYDLPANNGGYNGVGDIKNNYDGKPTDNKMKGGE
jgi:hypothetical protein